MTFVATVLALIGGGITVWAFAFDDEIAPVADTASLTGRLSDCTSGTTSIARGMNSLRIGEIVTFNISAPQDSVYVIDPSTDFSEAARGIQASYDCGEEFPPGLIISAENYEGGGGWTFEHGVYALTGSFALENLGIATGGVRWYSVRRVRPEDL
jgi:hypothetical protein